MIIIILAVVLLILIVWLCRKTTKETINGDMDF